MTSTTAATDAAQAGPPKPERGDVFRRKLARLGWGFSAPALIVIAAVTIFPIGYSSPGR
jgi:multiple sugar transport system permease protein